MSVRLTRKEIQEKYPDQWVGLVEVGYAGIYQKTRDKIIEYIGNCTMEQIFGG